MPWSSKSSGGAATILKNSDESSPNFEVSVLNYVPKNIEFGTPQAAREYLREKENGSDFVMSDVLRKTTGVEAIEKLSEETKIENKVLERVAAVQEEAYKQAYDLGLDEGLKKAYNDKSREINQALEDLQFYMANLGTIKEEMVRQNESHLIQLVYEIARRIAFDHIEEKPEVVLSVIQKAIEKAQADEEVTVLISKEQIDFLEKMKNNSGREYDFLKKVKFQVSEQVTAGSCIVETNYGVVDARIEERVEKLWTELKQTLPRVKSPIG